MSYSALKIIRNSFSIEESSTTTLDEVEIEEARNSNQVNELHEFDTAQEIFQAIITEDRLKEYEEIYLKSIYEMASHFTGYIHPSTQLLRKNAKQSGSLLRSNPFPVVWSHVECL